MKRDLYGRVFEKMAFPFLDRLNRTRIADKLEWLVAAEHHDAEEIRRLQATKLERVVNWAGRNSKFHASFWGEPATRRGPASLHPPLDGLPVVRKADLLAAGAEFPLRAHRGRTIACRTSGSTGSPMTFHRSAEQESWFWALRFRIWRWAGYHPGDPYLEINLNPRDQWKKRLQDLLFRCTYLTFNADNQDSLRIAETLIQRRIPHLNGFSSSLYALSRYMLEQGHSYSGMEGITSTGDTLYPPYREAIESAFGVRVLDYYGAGGEGVHLASQCPESGGRYHIHPENAVLELLDRDGPVPAGQPGRIIVTQLDNEAMPLIRYDLEDVAVAAPPNDVCPCGRSLPLLERIEGRAPDLISLPDGTFLVTHFFVVLFKNLQSVHRYQVVQEQIDRILLRLVAREGCDLRSVERAVRREIAAATRDALTVDVEWMDEIPLSGAGKRRLVISEVSRQSLGLHVPPAD